MLFFNKKCSFLFGATEEKCYYITMKYYASYKFTLHPSRRDTYILSSQKGEVPNLNFATFADNDKNKELGLVGLCYLRYTVPHSQSMRRYFAHTFEYAYGKPLTSTEHLNEKNQTFGDAKKIGLNDLILFEFSEDMTNLEVYFIKDRGGTKYEKVSSFHDWVNGESLIYSN